MLLRKTTYGEWLKIICNVCGHESPWDREGLLPAGWSWQRFPQNPNVVQVPPFIDMCPTCSENPDGSMLRYLMSDLPVERELLQSGPLQISHGNGYLGGIDHVEAGRNWRKWVRFYPEFSRKHTLGGV